MLYDHKDLLLNVSAFIMKEKNTAEIAGASGTCALLHLVCSDG